MKRTDHDLRLKLAARLREERTKWFRTAAEAARAMRLQPPRYVHYENGRRWIDRELAPLFARTFRVANPAYFLVLSASREGEADSHSMADIPVLAEAAVGVWREEGVDIMSHRGTKKLSVPPEVHWHSEKEYALEVTDSSLNKLIPKGGFCICREVKPGPVDTDQLDIGTFVHLERTRRGGLKEISVMRISKKNGAELRLTRFSSDKQHRSGEVVYPAKNAADSVTIKGVVVAIHVRMPALRA